MALPDSIYDSLSSSEKDSSESLLDEKETILVRSQTPSKRYIFLAAICHIALFLLTLSATPLITNRTCSLSSEFAKLETCEKNPQNPAKPS
jgi:hypothetical protein